MFCEEGVPFSVEGPKCSLRPLLAGVYSLRRDHRDCDVDGLPDASRLAVDRVAGLTSEESTRVVEEWFAVSAELEALVVQPVLRE